MFIKQLTIGCATAGALVLLAACSSSGSSGTKESTKPTASPSPTVTPATKAQLSKIVLQATDMPGWKGSPADPDNNDNSGSDLAACVGAKNTDPDEVATSESDDFTLGDVTVSSSASSYKSQSDLDNDVAVLKSPKLESCFEREFKTEVATSVPSGTTLGALSVKFTPGPGSGPANVAGTGSVAVPVTANGQQITVYTDIVFITGPLIEAEVDVESDGAPVPAQVLQAAVKAVATRAAAGG
jgi:hypothetical protein